jgi:hypothetical protein
MSKNASFWWGLFGAVLREVIRFFAIASRGDSLPNLNWYLYGVTLLLYILCAGFVSVAWRPENEFKAIWIGASLPAIVATLVQAAPIRST